MSKEFKSSCISLIPKSTGVTERPRPRTCRRQHITKGIVHTSRRQILGYAGLGIKVFQSAVLIRNIRSLPPGDSRRLAGRPIAQHRVGHISTAPAEGV